MSSKTGRSGHRTLLSGLTIATVMGAFAVGAPAALADNVSISVGANAEQGMPLNVTFTGSAGASDTLGDGDYFYAVDRPVDGTGCQATFGDDQGVEPDSDIIEAGTPLDANQSFSIADQITPDVGPQIVCAWIETDGDDTNPGDVSPAEVTSTMTADFSATGPQVGPIKVTVPAKITTGQSYTIKYATSSDQDLSLDSVVIPAATGGGCADSYEDQTAGTNNFNDVFGGSADANGQVTNSGTDSESRAGNYLICSWLEGPDDSQVDATQTTKITVSAPTTSGSGASTGAPAKATQTTRSSTTGPSNGGTGGTTSGPSVCTVPLGTGATLSSVKKHLLAAGCGVGAVHYVRTHRVRAGRVVKLARTPGRQLKRGTAVAITVARA